MLTESLDRAMERHGYFLTAFVYMPDHVHLLIFPKRGASPIHQLLKAIKRPVSWRIKQRLSESGSPLLRKLTVRSNSGAEVFRVWQAGPGYDRNLITLKTASATVQYIHLNPVRRGLVESELDWPWSSAHHYLDPGIEPDPRLPAVSLLSESLFT